MATHAGVALELGIVRPQEGKSKSVSTVTQSRVSSQWLTCRICMSPQMEAILIWCQCRTREYEVTHLTLSTQNDALLDRDL